MDIEVEPDAEPAPIWALRDLMARYEVGRTKADSIAKQDWFPHPVIESPRRRWSSAAVLEAEPSWASSLAARPALAPSEPPESSYTARPAGAPLTPPKRRKSTSTADPETPPRRIVRRGKPRTGSTKTWQAVLYGPPTGDIGRFMCFYRDPITEKRTSSSRATLAQASRMFDDIEAMLNAAEHGVLVAQRATVTDLATRHIESETARLDAGDIRSGTLDNTKRICRLHIIPVIGEVLVEQWGPDESREVLTAARNRGYEDLASIKKVLSALFSEAQVKPRLLSPGKNPLHKVSLPKHRGGEQGASQMYVPPDQRPETLTMRRLIVAVWLVGKQRSEPWLHVMIRLAAFGGLRFSELVALRARDYDPTTRTVLVQRTIEERNGKQAEAPTKNTRRRAVPIPRSADRFLLRRVKQVLAQEPGTGRWPLGGPDGLLFPGPGGNPWTRKYFRLMVYLPGCERIGWTTVTKAGNPTPRMHFHALRHHCATFWLASPPKGPGLAMEEAAQRMGHSVRVMQETYINPSEYARERIATALDRF